MDESGHCVQFYDYLPFCFWLLSFHSERFLSFKAGSIVMLPSNRDWCLCPSSSKTSVRQPEIRCPISNTIFQFWYCCNNVWSLTEDANRFTFLRKAVLRRVVEILLKLLAVTFLQKSELKRTGKGPRFSQQLVSTVKGRCFTVSVTVPNTTL
jgi:hypothetical protein